MRWSAMVGDGCYVIRRKISDLYVQLSRIFFVIARLGDPGFLASKNLILCIITFCLCLAGTPRSLGTVDVLLLFD